jgi:3-dehydrosphinganine reductase
MIIPVTTTIQVNFIWFIPVAAVFLIIYLFSLLSDFDLRGKHVFITGGSSGIGIETAKEYIKRGANVTIAARNKEKLAEAVLLLESYNFSVTKQHHRVVSISLDVSSSLDKVTSAVESAVKAHGRSVDVLVNCAGTSIAGAFDLTSTDEFEKLFRTNVLGSVFPTRAVVAGRCDPRIKTNHIIFFFTSDKPICD